MQEKKERKSILYKFLVSFVLMSIIPVLYAGYLIANYVSPYTRVDVWLSVEILIILFIVFIGAGIVKGLLRSVVDVGDQARKALEGKTETVKVKGEGEIVELADSLNAIISRIKHETSALEKSQLDLDGANRKLLDSYVKLQEANEKLKKLDQMKSDFVANVAHELLNPLAAVRETMDILRSNLDQKMDARQREVWEISRRNVVRLIRLVQDILDLSRIEAGKLELNLQEFSVADVLEEVLIPLEIVFRKKKLTLVKEIAPSLKTMRGDRDRVIQAVTNLLMNAVKFSPENGKVILSMAVKDRAVTVQVTDFGQGIDVKDQDKLFSKFERISVDKKEGTGLGLTITKDIISLHGGKIWVESAAGKGATFVFTVPQG